MALFGFTVFKEKILSGEKCQTIRPRRKRMPEVGETLHLYWKLRTKECERLMSVPCREVFLIKWKDMRDNLDLAVRDGFNDLDEFREWFARYEPKDETEFMVVRW